MNISALLYEKRNLVFELWNKQIILKARVLAETIGIEEIKNKTRTTLECLIDIVSGIGIKVPQCSVKVK